MLVYTGDFLLPFCCWNNEVVKGENAGEMARNFGREMNR
jgi:hypothetical protein